MAGYATTPLSRKLGLKPGQPIALVNAPPGFDALPGYLRAAGRRAGRFEDRRDRRDLGETQIHPAPQVTPSGTPDTPCLRASIPNNANVNSAGALSGPDRLPRSPHLAP